MRKTLLNITINEELDRLEIAEVNFRNHIVQAISELSLRQRTEREDNFLELLEVVLEFFDYEFKKKDLQ